MRKYLAWILHTVTHAFVLSVIVLSQLISLLAFNWAELCEVWLALSFTRYHWNYTSHFFCCQSFKSNSESPWQLIYFRKSMIITDSSSHTHIIHYASSYMPIKLFLSEAQAVSPSSDSSSHLTFCTDQWLEIIFSCQTFTAKWASDRVCQNHRRLNSVFWCPTSTPVQSHSQY